MSDSKAPAIRARLRYASIAEFKAGYSKFVSTGGMFIPVPESKLKPVGSDIRFQFMLNNGDTVLLGKGNVLQVRRPDPSAPNSPVGILVKFSKLSQDSKKIIDEIVAEKDNQKVPTQEVLVDEEEVEERGNYPTPAAVEAVAADISDDKTVVGTLDDIFRSQSDNTSLDEKTPTPEQISERKAMPADKETSAVEDLDDHLFRTSEPEPEPIEEIPIEKPASNIRVLSYDDMSAVDTDKVDFGFSGEESEIDDMFDDLFGKSGDSSFFDDVLGLDPNEKEDDAELLETKRPTPAPEFVSDDTQPETPAFDIEPPMDSEPEIISEDPSAELPVFTAPEEPIFEEDSEPELEEPAFDASIKSPIAETFSADPDDSLSMDDAFESEPEEDNFNDSLNAEPDLFLGETASDPHERINEVYESEEDENPFRADPPSIEMDVEELEAKEEEPLLVADSFQVIEEVEEKPELPNVDNSFESSFESSVVEFDLDPEPSIVEFDNAEPSEVKFESFDARDEVVVEPPVFEHDISRGGELDGLLGNLENDTPLDRSFNFGQAQEEIAAPEVGMNEESDSLEALLALANKDIESKKEEEQVEVDILDQLLGDEDLPPLPDVDNSFKMPTPEDTGKKKGLFSKLFSKD